MATNIGDGFKNIFLAGIGAMAITGEKAKEVVDKLVETGEMTVEQGKDINSELKHRADEATEGVREDSLEAFMKTMTPEQRSEFAAKAAEVAAQENAKSEAKSAKTKSDEAEGEAEVIEVEAVDESADGEGAGEAEN